MVGRVNLTKHISIEELEVRYRREENARVKERLLTILNLHEENTIREASKIVKRN